MAIKLRTLGLEISGEREACLERGWLQRLQHKGHHERVQRRRRE
jgi:hypothetical protein